MTIVSSKELAQKTEVERVIDQRITQREAASKLWSKRTTNQAHSGDAIDRKEMEDGFKKAENEATGERIQRYGKQCRNISSEPIMKGFGPTLMAEKLAMQKGICLSKETVQDDDRRGYLGSKDQEEGRTTPEPTAEKEPGNWCRSQDGSKHAWLEERGQKRPYWYL